jgi:hypothetical protein
MPIAHKGGNNFNPKNGGANDGAAGEGREWKKSVLTTKSI